MKRLLVLSLINILLLNSFLVGDDSSNEEEACKVVLASEIQWGKLNPARGDKSPKAATLWGNRRGFEATGFLVKFVDGFSSPPHIHNVSYRGVVIDGLVHNDDPSAKAMWMPKGSFWTQPKGSNHITAAQGSTIAYIEIERGPYLVLPSNKAFSVIEKPVNIHKSNIVWLDSSTTTWIKKTSPKAKIAFLWGKPQDKSGTLLKLPSGFAGKINSTSSILRSVVIQGIMQYKTKKETKTMKPGSYLQSKGEWQHEILCLEECILYIRANGKYNVAASESK